LGERLIVGLGNPGKDYEYTRHNMGFLVLRNISQRRNLKWKRSVLCNGMETNDKRAKSPFRLLIPLNYVNNSGIVVRQYLEKREINLSDLLVVCDDFNLSFGQLRVRKRGSDGGHNGLQSIIYHLNSEDFCRLRLGIGTPPPKQQAADYVLERFNKKEIKRLEPFIDEAADCCISWLTKEIPEVMSQFNKRKENE